MSSADYLVKKRECRDDGRCLDTENICEPCLEFRLSHSASGGRRDGLAHVVHFLEEEAKRHWLDDADDRVALVIRELAGQVRAFERDESARLDGFIKKSQPRKKAP